MKRNLVTIVFAILVLSLVAACSSNQPSSSENNSSNTPNPNGAVSQVSGVVRVAIAGWQIENGIDPITGMETIGLNQFLKDQFYPKYPNIKLEVSQTPWENVLAKQTAELLANNVDVLYTGYGSVFNQQGLLRGLDDLIAKDKTYDKSIYLKEVFESAFNTNDGTKQIGLPAALGNRTTIYDKQLFDEWGVAYLSEHPTPEEILDKAKKMTGKNPKTGKQNYGLWFEGNSIPGATFIALAKYYKAEGAAGSLNDKKNIKWNLNSPEMVKVMEWLQEAVKYMNPAFVNGKGSERFGLEDNNTAIQLDGFGYPVLVDYQSTGNEKLMKRYGSALNLGPKGAGWVAVDSIVMAKNAKNIEASWEVVKFLAGYERQKHWYKDFQFTPSLAAPDFTDPKDHFLTTSLKIAAVTKPSLLDEVNPFFNSELTPAVNGFISQAANGKAPDIKPFLDNLQQRAEKWSAK
ncbi:extracellular solute-binding protein [Paenibacillus sp. 481]|uniref:extracellular solute-binding protein n=1 Tax=Paenibacillus sp. 481 TaxID=2835869 RepID=UPI001E3D6F0E|nr:extracellular solute-binding protein [Paenibacillus sp. 481]UHA73519.1 extracellular solute-binding protein [Paenibacillus sp. 481]